MKVHVLPTARNGGQHSVLVAGQAGPEVLSEKRFAQHNERIGPLTRYFPR